MDERVQKLEMQVAALTDKLERAQYEIDSILRALDHAGLSPHVTTQVKTKTIAMTGHNLVVYHNPVEHMFHTRNVKRRSSDWWAELFRRFDEFTATKNPDYTIKEMAKELRRHWPNSSDSYVYKKHHHYLHDRT